MGKRRYMIFALTLCGLAALVFLFNREPAPMQRPGSAASTVAADRGSRQQLPGHARARARPRSDASPVPAGELVAPPHWQVGHPSDAQGAIAGRVVNRERRPIAGAEVCAAIESNRIKLDLRRTPACARTGADGRYRIEGLIGVIYGVFAQAAEHRPAHYLTAEDRRLGRISTQVYVSPGQVRSDIDLQLLSGGARVRGVTRDAGGGVVGSALVIAEPVRPGPAGAATRSDAEGRFELWVDDGPFELRASAEGYAEASREAIAPGDGFELSLMPASSIQGRVIDAAGRAVAGAAVMIEGEGLSAAGDYSGQDGRYSIETLPPGRFALTALAEHGYGKAAGQVRLGLAERVEGVDIVLSEAHPASGRVVLGEGPEGCAHATVTLRDDARHRFRDGQADVQGYVRFVGLLEGSYRVTVDCPGHATVAEYPEFAVGPGAKPGRWSVGPGGQIRGRVVDRSGHPVAAGSVFVQSPQRMNRWQMTSVDPASGGFVFSSLKPGTYILGIDTRSFELEGSPPKVELKAGAQVDDLTVTVVAPATVAGRVINGEGQAVPGVIVTALHDRGEGASTLSRADGSFELFPVPEGKVIVAAKAIGQVSFFDGPNDRAGGPPGQTVETRAGQRVDVTLTIPTANAAIDGQVLDHDGAPVDDAVVHVIREPPGDHRSKANLLRELSWAQHGLSPELTDSEGRFRVDGLAPGIYTVMALRKGGGAATAHGVQTGGLAELRMVRESSLSGRIVVPEGEVPDRFTVAVKELSLGVLQTHDFFASQGRFELTGLVPGRYQLEAYGQQWSGTMDFELAPGQQRDGLEIHMRGPIVVRGRIVAADTGQGLAGYHVAVYPAQGRSWSIEGENIQPSGSDGRFRFEHPAVGRAFLLVRSEVQKQREGPAKPPDPYHEHFRLFDLNSDVSELDLGDIDLLPLRVTESQPPGDCGFQLSELDQSVDPAKQQAKVVSVDRGSDAEAQGLKPGDVIVEARGVDVRGARSTNAYPAIHLPAGHRLGLVLADGRTLNLSIAPPK